MLFINEKILYFFLANYVLNKNVLIKFIISCFIFMSKFNLSKKWEADNSETDVFSLSYSGDGAFIGCGLSNGDIAIYSGTTGRLSFTLESNPEKLPVTSIRFLPTNPKHFISTSSDGTILCWNLRRPEISWSLKEEGNQTFALDINKNGELFVTAGLDTKVRLYDVKTQQLISVFEKSREPDVEEYPGHTNRVFSVLFNTNSRSLIYSAGWDDTIQVWDRRVKGSIHTIFGPHVCSDSLSFHEHLLAVGSWRTRDQLQLYDMRSLNVTQNFKWNSDRHCLVYATRFSHDGKYIFAGGSGTNEFATFSVDSGKQIGKSIVMKNTVFSIGVSNDGKEVSVGEVKGHVSTYSIKC